MVGLTITEVRKIRDWYQVVGYVGGNRYSGEIHAQFIEGQPEAEKHRLFEHTLRTTYNYERSH